VRLIASSADAQRGRCSLLVGREIGNLLPNNQLQRRTCYALCHILYPVSAATSISRTDLNSTSYCLSVIGVWLTSLHVARCSRVTQCRQDCPSGKWITLGVGPALRRCFSVRPALCGIPPALYTQDHCRCGHLTVSGSCCFPLCSGIASSCVRPALCRAG